MKHSNDDEEVDSRQKAAAYVYTYIYTVRRTDKICKIYLLGNRSMTLPLKSDEHQLVWVAGE